MLFHIGATCKLSLLCISVYECVACVDCSLRIRSNLILIPDACEGPFLRDRLNNALTIISLSYAGAFWPVRKFLWLLTTN